MRWDKFPAYTLMVCLVALISGCGPAPQTPESEQRDAYFVAGRSKLLTLDYNGAAENFEKAIETNPKNASAHYELGILYYQYLKDYASAIYHFQKYIKMRPTDPRISQIKSYIDYCKFEIAKSAPLGPTSLVMQRELDRLASENAALRKQLESLSRTLSLTTSTPPSVSAAPMLSSPQSKEPGDQTSAKQQGTGNNQTAGQTQDLKQSRPQTYVIKPGDTLSGIATKFKVKLSELKAANPNLDPRRLMPGQKINIPAR